MSAGSTVSRDALVHRGEWLARDMLELVEQTQHPDPIVAGGAVEGLKRIREAFNRIVVPALDGFGE